MRHHPTVLKSPDGNTRNLVGKNGLVVVRTSTGSPDTTRFLYTTLPQLLLGLQDLRDKQPQQPDSWTRQEAGGMTQHDARFDAVHSGVWVEQCHIGNISLVRKMGVIEGGGGLPVTIHVNTLYSASWYAQTHKTRIYANTGKEKKKKKRRSLVSARFHSGRDSELWTSDAYKEHGQR